MDGKKVKLRLEHISQSYIVKMRCQTPWLTCLWMCTTMSFWSYSAPALR